MKKLWIDLEGNLIPVSDSHEEWANQHGNELEALLDAGWVRVHNVPPAYLYFDFRLPLTSAQAVAVGRFLQNRFERVVVEFGGEGRTFSDGGEAMRYVLGR